MSLFDGTGADIWSMGAFPEESSLKDLLDSGIYTLEQLLCEEELLQDLKGLHPQLVAYLSKPQICRELVSYLTCASDQKSLSEEDDLNLSLRFPYIACEIICCEIPAIVDTLADGYIDDDNTSIFDESSTAGQENISLASNDDSSDLIITSQNSDLETDSKSGRIRLLDALFDLSLVEIKDQSEDGSSEDEELVVDDRLAGYLEKVLSVLFKLRPTTLATYLNENGNKLLPLFFRHISSYSIAQILQHLLVPMNKGNDDFNDDDDPPPALKDPAINTWMNNEETLTMLLQQIVSSTETETPKSFDEVTHSTEILIALLQSSHSPLERLLKPAIFSQILSSLTNIPEPYKPNESRLTHVLHILEGILLQLGGYGMHNRSTKELKLLIIPYLPQIIKALREILTHPSTQSWKMTSQMKKEIAQCGVPRLRGVRVLEALILLGEEEIDEVLMSKENGGGDLIKIACDLFWEMEWCSGLHQSIANMIVHVLEGRNKRYFAQNYLINEYNLLEKLLHAFEKSKEILEKKKIRLGYMGHVIIICQALEHIETSSEGSTAATDKEGNQGNQSRDEQRDTQTNGEIDEELKSIEKGIKDLDMLDEDENEDLPTNDSVKDSKDSDNKTGGSQEDIDINSFTLIGQAMSTPLPPAENSDGIDNNSDIDPSSDTIKTEPNHPSSKLIHYLHSHSAYSQWSSFLSTTLSEITLLQSSPLGGSSVDQLDNYGDIDETDHDILGAGVGGTSLDISENELDIAASMMDALSNGGSTMDAFSGDRGKNMSGHADYLYDDPLGRRPDDDDFGDDDDNKKGDNNQDDVDDDINGDSDVQVFDLFVPHFPGSYDKNTTNKIVMDDSDTDSDDGEETDDKVTQVLSKEPLDASWANFGDFESLPVEKRNDNTKVSEPIPTPQEDFFANFGEGANKNVNNTEPPNEPADCFFDADFSGFPSDAGDSDAFRNDIHDSDTNTEKEQMNGSMALQHRLQSNDSDYKVEDLFSENRGNVLSEMSTEDLAEKPGEEDDDPFGDFHKRRPSIDELF